MKRLRVFSREFPMMLDELKVNVDHLDGDALLKNLLRAKKFIGSNCHVQMVGNTRASGCVLLSGQIYSRTKPTVLGGEYPLSFPP